MTWLLILFLPGVSLSELDYFKYNEIINVPSGFDKRNGCFIHAFFVKGSGRFELDQPKDNGIILIPT